MTVLLINGSPRADGNTAAALAEMKKVFEAAEVTVKEVHVGHLALRGCISCMHCRAHGTCLFDDAVNKTAPLFMECDGMVVASPVYYASPNGTLVSFLDRLFCSTSFDKRMKVGASVSVARRGGCSSTFDQLNKYFTISGMPIASSQYWNMVYGARPGDSEKDAEGMQTMRTLASNMIFLMKCIAYGREAFGLPALETPERTNFIR